MSCDVCKGRKGWRMSCDVGEVTESLENELWRRWSDGKLGEWASSFSNPSVGLPTSQLILQPFRCFTYVTAHFPTLLSFLLRHRLFTYVTWLAAHVFWWCSRATEEQIWHENVLSSLPASSLRASAANTPTVTTPEDVSHSRGRNIEGNESWEWKTPGFRTKRTPTVRIQMYLWTTSI